MLLSRKTALRASEKGTISRYVRCDASGWGGVGIAAPSDQHTLCKVHMYHTASVDDQTAGCVSPIRLRI